jgi:hypothetical protein
LGFQRIGASGRTERDGAGEISGAGAEDETGAAGDLAGAAIGFAAGLGLALDLGFTGATVDFAAGAASSSAAGPETTVAVRNARETNKGLNEKKEGFMGKGWMLQN